MAALNRSMRDATSTRPSPSHRAIGRCGGSGVSICPRRLDCRLGCPAGANDSARWTRRTGPLGAGRDRASGAPAQMDDTDLSDGRSLVVGGGLSGLAAAAALAVEPIEVVVLDRSFSPADGHEPTRHPHRLALHNLLTRGQRHLEELLPGFREAFLEAGGTEAGVSHETHVHEFGGDAIERPLGLSIWSAPWQTIWQVARSLLPANVQFRHAAEVEGISVHDGQVTGVRVLSSGGSEHVDADTVIDASGHSSSFPRLLSAAGVSIPRVERNQLDRWFVTTRLRRPPTMRGRPDFWLTFGDPPDRDVALISPHGPDEWLLSVSSQGPAHPPPGNFDSVLAFLDRLPGKPLRDIVGPALPRETPAPFWRRVVRWHHYEELEEPLRGFAPIGDAFASINPVYGQGVSVATWQASTLRSARSSTGRDDWSPAYIRAAGEIVGQAWALDGVPFDHGSASDWYALLRRLADDPALHRRYVGLWHMIEPVSSLRGLVAEANDHQAVREEDCT